MSTSILYLLNYITAHILARKSLKVTIYCYNSDIVYYELWTKK